MTNFKKLVLGNIGKKKIKKGHWGLFGEGEGKKRRDKTSRIHKVAKNYSTSGKMIRKIEKENKMAIRKSKKDRVEENKRLGRARQMMSGTSKLKGHRYIGSGYLAL